MRYLSEIAPSNNLRALQLGLIASSSYALMTLCLCCKLYQFLFCVGMYVCFCLLDEKFLRGKARQYIAIYGLYITVTSASCHLALHTKALDNKQIMSTHYIKLCKSHIRSFETSTEVLFLLTFGGIFLLNLHADLLAWDRMSCGKQVFSLFSQAHEIECHFIYRSLWRPSKHGSTIIYQKPLIINEPDRISWLERENKIL